MLLYSLRALCLSPGGSGSGWKYLEALVTSPGVSGRIVWCFRTDLHFTDDMISPKEDMVEFKCSPLSYWQVMGRQLQAHLECLQHCLETIQSFGRPLRPPLHLDNLPVHLRDPPLTFQ